MTLKEKKDLVIKLFEYLKEINSDNIDEQKIIYNAIEEIVKNIFFIEENVIGKINECGVQG